MFFDNWGSGDMCRVKNWDVVAQRLGEYYGTVEAGLLEYGIPTDVQYGNHEIHQHYVPYLQEAVDCIAEVE